MEHIMELNEGHQLTIPPSLVTDFDLKPGAHFKARSEGGNLVIEYLPFSSLEQGELLEKTIHSLQK